MKNTFAICGLSRQLAKVCESIESLASCIDQSEDSGATSTEVLEGILLDEVEHAQILTLEITKLLTPETEDQNADEGDGSAFASGELTDDLGEVENPEAKATQ